MRSIAYDLEATEGYNVLQCVYAPEGIAIFDEVRIRFSNLPDTSARGFSILASAHSIQRSATTPHFIRDDHNEKHASHLVSFSLENRISMPKKVERKSSVTVMVKSIRWHMIDVNNMAMNVFERSSSYWVRYRDEWKETEDGTLYLTPTKQHSRAFTIH